MFQLFKYNSIWPSFLATCKSYLLKKTLSHIIGGILISTTGQEAIFKKNKFCPQILSRLVWESDAFKKYGMIP